jgi:hypothetical protein
MQLGIMRRRQQIFNLDEATIIGIEANCEHNKSRFVEKCIWEYLDKIGYKLEQEAMPTAPAGPGNKS